MRLVTNRDLVAEMVRVGVTQGQVAVALGMHPSTLSRWLDDRDAKPSDERKARILDGIEAAAAGVPTA